MKTRTNLILGVAVVVTVCFASGGCPELAPAGTPAARASVKSTQPANGARDVATDSVMSITFDRAAVADSLDGSVVPDFGYTLSWSADGATVTLAANEPLQAETQYSITISACSFKDGSLLGSSYSFSFTTQSDSATETGPLALSDVRFWGYQIQSVSDAGAVDALADSHYDMLVLEPTRTDWSSNAREFDAAAMISRLKATKASDGTHRKLLIAYIDIGEAEDWRWYWTWSQEWLPGTPKPADWPDYIITHDPDGWGGNYPVAYWDDAWKDIVIYGRNQDAAPNGDYTSMIDEVLRDGFDGIYLDWVEGFENVGVAAAAKTAGLNPAVEMIKFIREMRAYARARDPDFLIIQQNAAALAEGRSELFDVIDAIAQEEIWFDGVATDDWNDTDGYDRALDAGDSDEIIGLLAAFRDAGIPVFNCEYALDQAAEAYRRSYERGYVPYCSRRSLGALTTTPPAGLPR